MKAAIGINRRAESLGQTGRQSHWKNGKAKSLAWGQSHWDKQEGKVTGKKQVGKVTGTNRDNKDH